MLLAKEQGEPFSNYMGRGVGIANPLGGARCRMIVPSSASLCEERIGGGAVGGDFVAVGDNPGDFRLQQRDPLGQISLRIGREILLGEATRCIPAGSWKIGFIHQTATSQAKRLAVNPRQGYSRHQVGY